jgi:tryptophan synthase alpha chain
MAFMPFVTAGDPDLDMTAELIRTLGREHVDLIEVGFPYSDPIADGPVVQASYTRALKKKIRVADIFRAIGGLKSENVPPLVAMVAYSIIYRSGIETFLSGAAEAGFAGLIVPDLPGDEAGEFAHMVRGYGLDLVQLVAPTTPPERVEKIIQSASGFLYCISVAGVTGARDSLPPALVQQLDDLRKKTNLPLAVGFGISRPEQVDMLSGHADGVIVGSAIVRKLEPLAAGTADRQSVLREVDQFAAAMVAAVAGGNAPES